MSTNKANQQVIHDMKVAMGVALDLNINLYNLDRDELLEVAKCSLKAKQAWTALYYDALITLSDKDTREVESLKAKIDELTKLRTEIPIMQTKIDELQQKQSARFD
jgi:alkyl sulfatase BDS1-like metallo-beta-lactamase superfamily hydrolase